jgi:hypothetical protein
MNSAAALPAGAHAPVAVGGGAGNALCRICMNQAIQLRFLQPRSNL